MVCFIDLNRKLEKRVRKETQVVKFLRVKLDLSMLLSADVDLCLLFRRLHDFLGRVEISMVVVIRSVHMADIYKFYNRNWLQTNTII